MTTPSDLNPTSPGLIPLGQIKQEPDLHTPSRRRAKLKPDLKLKVVYIYIELYCLFRAFCVYSVIVNLKENQNSFVTVDCNMIKS